MSTANYAKRMGVGAFLVSLAMFLPGAHAQSMGSVARATVPFAFQYGTRQLPAGRYTLILESPQLMRISGAKGSALMLVRDEDRAGLPQYGRLLFHHTGEGYQLQDVWTPDRNLHLVCIQPKAKSHAHELEKADAQPAYVEVGRANTGQ